jgi:hypothetical protein
MEVAVRQKRPSLAVVGSALLVLVVAAGGACGGIQPDPFVGSWKCSGSEATSYSQPAGMMPTTETVGSTVVITDDGIGNLTRVRTPDNGNPVCTLHAKLALNRMTFNDTVGETCMTKVGNVVTYSSGSAMISDAGYTAMSRWTLTGKNTAGATLVGDGTATSTCTKM